MSPRTSLRSLFLPLLIGVGACSWLQRSDSGSSNPGEAVAATPPPSRVTVRPSVPPDATVLAVPSAPARPSVEEEMRALAAASADAGDADSGMGNVLDAPLSEVWPYTGQWSQRMEDEYAQFVETMGRAVAERRCGRVQDCLRRPEANSLYDGTENRFVFDIDCGDLPYVLRAYFAFKRKLPFGWVSVVHGRGTDVRYMLGVWPGTFEEWNRHYSVRSFFRHLTSDVHSGMYRVAADRDDGDLYPAAINRHSIRPGTVFYDPNGHVLLVSEVHADGSIFLIDGHPDGSITWKRFGQAFEQGVARLAGGFKNFRPLTFRNGHIERTPNRQIADYDPTSQYDRTKWVVAGAPTDFYTWVRTNMAEANAHLDPIAELREEVRALCRDVTDRADAVNFSVAAGLQNHSHPGRLPDNIYGTFGDWETYSTPSRDARLKAAVREVYQLAQRLAGDPVQREAAVRAWTEEVARPECRYSYTNSAGQPVAFTFETVLDRLYDLSFDPYHCVELRWGAAPGSPEAATCATNPEKDRWYRVEQRLRNRIDRAYGVPTPLDSGPATAAVVDPRRALGLR